MDRICLFAGDFVEIPEFDDNTKLHFNMNKDVVSVLGNSDIIEAELFQYHKTVTPKDI